MIDEITITSLSGRGSVFMRTKDYSSYWLGPVDWGQVSGTHNTYRYYNQVGANIVSTTIGTRPLSITGWVVDAGAGDLRERCDFLNTFISPVENYELEYKDRKIQFRPDSSVIYSREYMKNNEKVRRFLIQATCSFPLFSDVSDTEVPFESNSRMFRFPTKFGRENPLVFSVVGSSYNVSVENRGGFSAGFIVRIKFSGGVYGPYIANLDTGDSIGVNHTFSNGDQLEICTIPGEKHITLRKSDGGEENLLKQRAVNTVWFQLSPGINHISVGCQDNAQRSNMSVTLYYSTLYLEVE